MSSVSVTDKLPKAETFPSELLETVEDLIDYQFQNRKLLEEALTHPSVADADSYLRLKYIGAAILRLVFSVHQYVNVRYRGLDTVELSRIRDANLGTRNLASIAARHGLNWCICHDDPQLSGKWVDDFVSEVRMHDKTIPYRGIMKVPQVLADIIESLAGAVYIDTEKTVGTVWLKMSGLLDPLVTLDMLNGQQPQPITTFLKACQVDVPTRTPLPRKREPSERLAALLAKKHKVSATPSGTTAPPARRSIRILGKRTKTDELERELREASRKLEAATKVREEKISRKRATQALEAYGDDIVGMVNTYYFDSHVRALTLAGVAPKDPLWYSVDFPFEGTTPEMKFHWEVPSSASAEEIP